MILSQFQTWDGRVCMSLRTSGTIVTVVDSRIIFGCSGIEIIGVSDDVSEALADLRLTWMT